MYGQPDNDSTLSAELGYEISRLNSEIASHERQIAQCRERQASLQLRVDALKPRVIDFIDYANDDRQRIHAALNSVRKTFGKGISLDRHVAYNGDNLIGPAYVSYPMGAGCGEAIVAALKAQGLAVEWDGNEGRAIVIKPSIVKIAYRMGIDWSEPDGVRASKLMVYPEHREQREWVA